MANGLFDLEFRQPSPCQPGTYSVYSIGYDMKKIDLDALAKAFDLAVKRGELFLEDIGWARKFSIRFLKDHGGNCNHISGINAADSAMRTRIEIAGRESLLRLYRFLRKQPGFESLEFIPKGGECGVRETRTVVGEATVTVEDYESGRIFPDAICYSFYPIDLHDAEVGLVYRELAADTVPTVPLGALIPRESRRMLVAGRIISSDRLANSALRIQATCMATGQAAGAVAALSATTDKTPRDLEFAQIRQLLLKNEVILP
ncbi:MAG: FAD-dependent oxidoreductase [Victivallales bacterium]|jgi:hypothetical protein|nr:FAD-dependent oxidoreductase [Victivallales bacterium]